MGQALYRKYRSKNLGEIVGQEHITDTLNQALKSGRISHAYLFTGPRGVGKTSIARILAHELNNLEYQHEDNHIDIIEIDAASNRGIDEIRDLREKAYSAPVAAKYKVYIIDEVHMLTTPAFNALLKTLEEPPEHVIFILATTEAHKLPETIISRTQRYIFRPVELEKVVGHLRTIAKAEGIKIDDEALVLIAAHGGGSFRDSISLLDQASNSGKKIDRATAEALLGIPPDAQAAELLHAVTSGSPATIMTHIEQLLANGFHAAAIAKKLGELLRAQVIEGRTELPLEAQLTLMRNLLEVSPAYDPIRALEVALLSAAPLQPARVSAPAPTQPEAPTATPSQPIEPSPKSKKSTPKPQAAATEPTALVAELPESDTILDAAIWPEILGALKSKYNTLYGVMRMAVPEFEPGLMRLRFQFAFHQKRMNEVKHREIVSQILTDLTGQRIRIECVHDKEAQVTAAPPISAATASKPAAKPVDDSLSTISNIFGGGELLES